MPNNKATRRFVGLKIGEVSIVDDNAIEKPVAVMKRKETEPMTTPADNAKQTNAAGAPGTEVTKNADASAQPNVENIEYPATAEIIKRLVSTVETLVAKSTAGTVVAPEPPVVAPVSADVVKAALEGAGLNEEQVAKALSAVTEPKAAETPPTANVAKAAELQESQMQVLETLSEAITKAKAFTPKRLGELESVADTLNNLLAEINTSAEVEKSKAAPTPVPVEKAKGEPADISAQLTEIVAKALKPLADELAILKATRLPPTGTAEDGKVSPKTNGETVETTKNLWSNIV